MKISLRIFGLLFFVSTYQTHAMTMGLFYEDEFYSKLIVRGSLNDEDTTRLYAELTANEVMDSGYKTKRFTAFNEALSIDCAMSVNYPNVGTCAITINESPFAKINYEQKKVIFENTNENCQEFLKHFYHQENNSQTQDLYVSQNKRVSIGWEPTKNRCWIKYD